MKEKPTTRLLKSARALIARPNGWCKRSFADGSGVCAIGALNRVSLGSAYGAYGDVHTRRLPAGRLRAESILGEVVGGSIIAFNDSPATKKKDVLEAFDKAIELSVQS